MAKKQQFLWITQALRKIFGNDRISDSKHGPRAQRILFDLRFKKVKTVEFLLGADEGAKADVNHLTVNILVEIENMNFEPGLIAVNGRSGSGIGDARQPFVRVR